MIILEYNSYVLLRGGEDFEAYVVISHLFHVKKKVLACLLHHAQFAIGHEVLRE